MHMAAKRTPDAKPFANSEADKWVKSCTAERHHSSGLIFDICEELLNTISSRLRGGGYLMSRTSRE